jgi:hypothetical protein
MMDDEKMNKARTVSRVHHPGLNRLASVDEHPHVVDSPTTPETLLEAAKTEARFRPSVRSHGVSRAKASAEDASLAGLASWWKRATTRAVTRSKAGSPVPPLAGPWKSSVRPNRAGDRLEAGLVIAIPATLYLAVGWILAFKYASFNGDAQARLANAYYVLFSRDPHLAAIGFVWNPLPSASVLPLLPLKALWPALATRAFAGNIMSAIFMAGAVYQLYGFLRDIGLKWPVRVALIAIFGSNPMIIYYGANGMSEALFMFTLLLGVRYLSRWVVDDRTVWLVVAAGALGLAYLARNEAAFAALCAAALVVIVTYIRGRSDRRERIYKALTDGFVFSLPFAACFVGWAIVSWIIVGHPFEQFQSVYGTASQLRVINQANPVHLSKVEAASRAIHAVNSMAPALPLFISAAVYVAVKRRDLRAFASLALLGGVLLFAVLAYSLGQTAGWYRYYIMTVPLVVLLTGSIIAGVVGSRRHRGMAVAMSSPRRLEAVLQKALILLLLAAVAVNIPTTAETLRHGSVASEEQLHLNYIFHRVGTNGGEAAERDRYASTVSIARALDAMHLAHGALLIDNFTPCVPYVILNSRDPQQFIIPNDQDFQPALADPVTFHVRYLMAPAEGGYGALDAVNREYPTLYGDGAGISRPVKTFDLPGCPALTLFQVNTSGPA